MNGNLRFSAYHSILRVGMLIVATMLLFDSGLLSSTTAHLSKNTQLYLANAVGVYVGVAENEFNVLTARIAELEQDVAQKDRELSDRSMNIGLGSGSGAANSSTFILSGVLFVMLVLIVLNYALDYARARERYAVTSSR